MPEQQDTPFGRTIYDARQAKGWSLRVAAERIGISYPRLDEFEKGVDGHTGKPVRPTYPTVLAMARAYEMPPMSLLALAGYELPATEEEMGLLQGFRLLDRGERQRVLALVAELTSDVPDDNGAEG